MTLLYIQSFNQFLVLNQFLKNCVWYKVKRFSNVILLSHQNLVGPTLINMINMYHFISLFFRSWMCNTIFCCDRTEVIFFLFFFLFIHLFIWLVGWLFLDLFWTSCFQAFLGEKRNMIDMWLTPYSCKNTKFPRKCCQYLNFPVQKFAAECQRNNTIRTGLHSEL